MDVRELRTKFNLSQQELSNLTGIPKGRINSWEQRGSTPKAKDYKILESLFHELENKTIIQENTKVLKGSQFMNTPLNVPKCAHWKGVPMYNAIVSASFIELYRDDFYTPQYYLPEPRFSDCNFGIMISGDSMYPDIKSGDFIVCKEVLDPSFIAYGEAYYIVASNGLETCKLIHPDPEDDSCFLLIAKNETIPPYKIKKEMIKKIFKVRGIVRVY